MTKQITVSTTVNAPIQKVWEFWNKPEHLVNWAFASNDWHTPKAENDIRTGGKFLIAMAAKDGSASFDFAGVYTNVVPYKLIEYTIAGEDKRKVRVEFADNGGHVKITETFDPENINSEEMQKSGWQAILENFKKYTEAQ